MANTPAVPAWRLILHDATEARQKTFDAIESERVQALTLLAASVAHEIGNPLNALHIHLQLMEREVKKLKPAGRGGWAPGRKRRYCPAAETADARHKLEQYLSVAKGEINRLDYIVTQFLQAIRPAPLQLNPVVERSRRAHLELLRPELENRGIT
jgi:two-component system, sporulation sensor kinase E